MCILRKTKLRHIQNITCNNQQYIVYVKIGTYEKKENKQTGKLGNSDNGDRDDSGVVLLVSVEASGGEEGMWK
jgi:hypothetical protein